MLNKIMIGRLGNQMFQYAAVRAFQYKYARHESINLNFAAVYREGSRKKGFYNHLEQFNIAPHHIDKRPKLTLKQWLLFVRNIIFCKIVEKTRQSKYPAWKQLYDQKHQEKQQKNGLYLYSFGYYPFKNTSTKNKLFVGYYESAKFFDDIKPILQKEFTPKEPKLKKNKSLYQIISSSESVCISIRRGDFLDPKQRGYHYVCTPEYFNQAIEEIQQRIKHPRFIVFSDDIEWVKHNMDFPKNTLFEDGTDPVWEKLRLMYSCKHFIISNSTFSWWAQYLSRNEDKVVIAPSRWENGSAISSDIYEKGWALIDIDKL